MLIITTIELSHSVHTVFVTMPILFPHMLQKYLHFVSAQAIVLCFRLHFTKDNITNNTAAATVRQVVTVVFERMVAEDERFKGTSGVVLSK